MRKVALTMAATLGAVLLLSGCERANGSGAYAQGGYPCASGQCGSGYASGQGGGMFSFMSQPHPPLRFVARGPRGYWDRQVYQ